MGRRENFRRGLSRDTDLQAWGEWLVYGTQVLMLGGVGWYPRGWRAREEQEHEGNWICPKNKGNY
jgi:hypothetical protein